MPKISLIIPVYNVEKYLKECLDSCINQTLRDIEIICVNDCSPDNSALILKEYAAKDSRVRVINHEINKGLGAARNTGIDNATGEYIWFIDSDDYVDLNACQILYDEAVKHNVDVLSFQALIFYCDNDQKKMMPSNLIVDWPKNCNLNVSCDKKLKGNINVSACCYISKKDFLTGFSFREGVFYEDVDFTLILFAQCKRFRCIAYTPYFYRTRNKSIMHTPITKKNISDHISFCLCLYNFIRTKRISSHFFLYQSFLTYLQQTNQIIKNSDFVEEGKQEMKSFYQIYKRFRFNFFIRNPVQFLKDLKKIVTFIFNRS